MAVVCLYHYIIRPHCLHCQQFLMRAIATNVARCVVSVPLCHTEPCKTTAPIRTPVWADYRRSNEPCARWCAHQRHTAKATERFVRGGDAALCPATVTTSYYSTAAWIYLPGGGVDGDASAMRRRVFDDCRREGSVHFSDVDTAQVGACPVQLPAPHTHTHTRYDTDTTRHDMIRYDTIRHETTRYDTIRHDTIRYDTTRHDTIRHDTIRYDTTRHDTIRHDTIRYDVKTAKLTDFMLKCLVLKYFYGHVTPVSLKGPKCRQWQLLQ